MAKTSQSAKAKRVRIAATSPIGLAGYLARRRIIRTARGGALVRRHEVLSLLELNASLLPMLTDDGLVKLTADNTGRNKGTKLDHKTHVLATLRRMRQEAR